MDSSSIVDRKSDVCMCKKIKKRFKFQERINIYSVSLHSNILHVCIFLRL